VPGAPVDLARERVDLAVKVADQPQQRLQPRARVGAQLELVEKPAAAGTEQVGMRALDSLGGRSTHGRGS
jgi:hypothetical protein